SCLFKVSRMFALVASVPIPSASFNISLFSSSSTLLPIFFMEVIIVPCVYYFGGCVFPCFLLTLALISYPLLSLDTSFSDFSFLLLSCYSRFQHISISSFRVVLHLV